MAQDQCWKFPFFHRDIQFFQCLLLHWWLFPSLNYLGNLVENQLTVCVWSVSGVCFVPLIRMFALMLIPRFILVTIAVESVWKSGSASLPTWCIFTIVLVTAGPLHVYLTFVTSLPISTKKPPRALIVIARSLQISLEAVDILTVSTHLILDFYLYLFMSSLIYLSSVFIVFSTGLAHILLTLSLRMWFFLCYYKWYFLNFIFLLFVASI